MEFTTIGNLPKELEREILLRLPVKALLRCKSVCKPWCGLIGSLKFVKDHYDHESNQQRLLIRLRMPEQVSYKHVLYVDESFSEYEEPSHLQIPGPVTNLSDLIGPVNGVFCVVSMHPWGTMALLNPALRQFKPLPLVEKIDIELVDFECSELGFGFDPLTGDYKLVLIADFRDRRMIDEEESPCVVYVCTSDSDSWRLLEDVDPIVSSDCLVTSRTNTYLNGVYYWLSWFHKTNGDATIHAFDMRTEKFREIQVTGCVVDQSKAGRLALCGDSLALLVYDQCETVDGFIDVWIMENEGCWIQSSRVGRVEGIGNPHCFWKNNVLLFTTMNFFLALCDVTTEELRTYDGCRMDEHGDPHWVFIYKESLVSIKGEAGKCKLWDTSSDFVKDFFEIPAHILDSL